jgi:hypothetical protein
VSPIDPRASALRLLDLRRYLDARGFRPSEELSDAHVDVYESDQRDDDGEPLRLLLPTAEGRRDADQMITNVVHALAAIEGRAASAVIDEIARADLDVFSTRILTQGGGHRVSFREALVAHASLFDLFAFAASAEMKPQPYFPEKLRDARRFAGDLQLPVPEAGSFVLRIESRVEAAWRPRARPGGAEEMPFARRVMVRVVRGLRDGLGLRASTPDAMFLDGLNANMCDALIALEGAFRNAAFEFDVGFCRAVPVPADLRRATPIRYEGSSFEAIRELGGILRQPPGPRRHVLAGHVVELKAKREGDRVATIAAEVDGRPYAVRVSLSARDYQLACDAHRDQRAVRVAGVLERVGRHWQLLRYEGLEVGAPMT